METIENFPNCDLALKSPINVYFDSVDDYSRDLTCFEGLSIFQLNCRSIANLDRFDALKFTLGKLSFLPDVIVICETWIPFNLTELYSIDGYEGIFSCRNQGRGGGLAMFVSKCLSYDIISSSEVSCPTNSFHHIQIKIKLRGYRNFFISSYYRPPDYATLPKFLEHLECVFEANTNSPHCVVGDVNVDVRSRNFESSDYNQLITSYGYFVTNSEITRLSSNAILDHVLFNQCENFAVTNDTIFNSDSDHNIIVSYIPMECWRQPNSVFNKKHLVDYHKLGQLLDMRFSPSYVGNFDDPNLYYNFFIQTLTKSIAECTTTKILKTKNSLCPWITPGLKALMQSSKNLRKKRKKIIKAGMPTDQIDIQILSLSTKIKSYINIIQQQYYHKKFLLSKNSKDTWNNINEMLGRKIQSKLPDVICKTSCNGNTESIVDKQAIVNEFNVFFTSIGDKMASQLVSYDYDDINKYSTLMQSSNSLFLEPASEYEVCSLINNLKNKASPGYDKISAVILKSNKSTMSKVLSDIFNLCMESGIYPDKLKIARVTPVYKSGNASSLTNYRPVSVLSTINKLFEQILFKRISSFLNNNDFFYSQQYGFREKSSTSNAVVEMVNKIQLYLDNRLDVLGVFLDLSKAFDTVNRSILAAKLNFAGIRGIPLMLLQSYLSQRYQFVSVQGVSSSLELIDLGVPQGSVLGPLLFLIYLNDISLLPLKGELRLYADDSALLYKDMNAVQNDKNLTTDLLLLADYFRINKLSLNINKSKIINVKNSSNSAPNRLINTKMAFPSIETTSEYKYLGILVDNRLNWGSHINSILLKLNKITGVICKIKHRVPQDTLLLIYNSLFHSVISYLTMVWGSATNNLINKVQVAQNRILKIIFHLPMRSHSVNLYKMVLPVRGIYIFQSCCFIYSCINNLTHHNIDFTRPSHLYLTRSRNLLNRPRICTKVGENSLSFRGVQFYNFFEQKFGNINLSLFKKELKKYMLNPDVVATLLKSTNIL